MNGNHVFGVMCATSGPFYLTFTQHLDSLAHIL